MRFRSYTLQLIIIIGKFFLLFLIKYNYLKNCGRYGKVELKDISSFSLLIQ